MNKEEPEFQPPPPGLGLYPCRPSTTVPGVVGIDLLLRSRVTLANGAPLPRAAARGRCAGRRRCQRDHRVRKCRPSSAAGRCAVPGPLPGLAWAAPGQRDGRGAGREGGCGAGGRVVGGRALGALRSGRFALATTPAPRAPEAAPGAGPWSHQHLLGSAGDAAGARRGWGSVQGWHHWVRHGQSPRGRDLCMFSSHARSWAAWPFPGGGLFVDALHLYLFLPHPQPHPSTLRELLGCSAGAVSS